MFIEANQFIPSNLTRSYYQIKRKSSFSHLTEHLALHNRILKTLTKGVANVYKLNMGLTRQRKIAGLLKKDQWDTKCEDFHDLSNNK